jgi:hypothetical protein
MPRSLDVDVGGRGPPGGARPPTRRVATTCCGSSYRPGAASLPGTRFHGGADWVGGGGTGRVTAVSSASAGITAEGRGGRGEDFGAGLGAGVGAGAAAAASAAVRVVAPLLLPLPSGSRMRAVGASAPSTRCCSNSPVPAPPGPGSAPSPTCPRPGPGWGRTRARLRGRLRRGRGGRALRLARGGDLLGRLVRARVGAGPPASAPRADAGASCPPDADGGRAAPLPGFGVAGSWPGSWSPVATEPRSGWSGCRSCRSRGERLLGAGAVVVEPRWCGQLLGSGSSARSSALRGHGQQRGTLSEVHQPDPLGLPTRLRTS